MPNNEQIDRTAVVLSGGGARGAYEAGVLSYLFERVYPELGPDFEFDIASGTSVGAIHAAYTAATSHMDCHDRSKGLVDTWADMAFGDVLKFSPSDLVTIPLRMLGLGRKVARHPIGTSTHSLGGLIDVSPVKSLVTDRIPWDRLPENLARRRPGAVCVACTEVRTGRIAVFLDGPGVDTTAWENDPHAKAHVTTLTPRHVRASAAIPFIFPAVEIDGQHYLDGGLRANTPLAPALRMRANRILVIALRHSAADDKATALLSDEIITQPTFLLGKLLNILFMDQLEQELRQLEIINLLIEGAEEALGDQSWHINDAVREKRGIGYRHVDTFVLRPSVDIGSVAAECNRNDCISERSRGFASTVLRRTTAFGSPNREADLLSYLYFDSGFTLPLIELGREDAARNEESIYRLLAGEKTSNGNG